MMSSNKKAVLESDLTVTILKLMSVTVMQLSTPNQLIIDS